jgi:ADP-heptose:LPS heptosyltransferase
LQSIVARGAALPAFDRHCPLGSLPLAFKTEPGTIPAEIPYLKADDAHLAKWRPRIEALGRPRIALAWSGNASHVNDRNRSIAFAALSPLLAVEDIRFISIQRDVRAADAEFLSRAVQVTPLGEELADFADTAAVIALADLVICVDTAVAHLAGAMGRRVWVLLPFSPDWRWSLAGETSRWYPTARLFRQPSLGDWDSVVEHVAAELTAVIRAVH